MEALHGILKGRFGYKAAGHWVSTTSEIDGVKLLSLSVTRGVRKEFLTFFQPVV
jgi:hypothetical protein